MKQILLQEKFPIFSLEVNKDETDLKDAQAAINYFKELVDDHPVTRFIGEFDHYSHTRGLEEGEIAEGILDARNIVFCFGTKLPKAEMMAVRPRSIGVVEMPEKFIISFMEAPMEMANKTMTKWVESVVKQSEAA
jgi:hypothetical protein